MGSKGAQLRDRSRLKFKLRGCLAKAQALLDHDLSSREAREIAIGLAERWRSRVTVILEQECSTDFLVSKYRSGRLSFVPLNLSPIYMTESLRRSQRSPTAQYKAAIRADINKLKSILDFLGELPEAGPTMQPFSVEVPEGLGVDEARRRARQVAADFDVTLVRAYSDRGVLRGQIRSPGGLDPGLVDDYAKVVAEEFDRAVMDPGSGLSLEIGSVGALQIGLHNQAVAEVHHGLDAGQLPELFRQLQGLLEGAAEPEKAAAVEALAQVSAEAEPEARAKKWKLAADTINTLLSIADKAGPLVQQITEGIQHFPM